MKAIVVLVLVARAAHAYPQFQLSRDQTCTSCHISPAGGGLLDENGRTVAESQSTYGGPPEALHGKLGEPAWLLLGGDLRAGAGLNDDLGAKPAAFPMQADLAAAIRGGHGLTFALTFGPQVGDPNRPQTLVASREHWLMWQANDNLYVRAGRLMPVYGLRFAEHTVYTMRYGQVPLYGEAYGVAIEYVDPAWEVHVTGFAHDPLQDAIERGDGAAVYAEARPVKRAAIGVEGRYAKSDEEARTAGGVTAKYWLDPVLLEAEGQAIHQTFAAGGKRDQIVSYLLASWFVRDAWMLDVGVGQYDEDIAVKHADLECIDANLHWFATSHWELLLTNRLQTIAFGSGGSTSGFALLQIHYRL